MTCLRYLTLMILLPSCIWAQGTITTIAGNGITQYIGDGWPATNYSLALPMGICTDGNGNVYVADYAISRIRRIDSHDTIFTHAGTGTMGYSGDGGPATAAQFQDPTGVAMDAAGNIYVAEEYNNVIRRIDAATGIITTVCGTGVGGFSGDGGPAIAAQLSQPADVCVDRDGNIYISDKGNQRIRRVDGTTGTITTYAGAGVAGFNNNDIPATGATLSYPAGICADTAGNIYIADNGNNMVRRIGTDGIIRLVAGTGAADYNGNHIPASTASLAGPTDVYVSRRDNIYIADHGNNMVRVVNTDGYIRPLAGSGAYGFAVLNGPALDAVFIGPTGVCADDDEYVYIADGGNSAIHKVTPVYNAVNELPEAPIRLQLYPNPSSGIFHLHTSYRGSTTVTVCSVTGTVVQTLSTDTGETDVDISAQPPGVYVVHIYSNGSTATGKISLVH